ncbi:MAG: DnaJ domain-containing protein [Candidatus Sabulitectum sp.]|nr:DnaJ domain-containing protein [Candidatus Sabulitectum sp.]
MSNVKAVNAFFYPKLAWAIITAQNAGWVIQEGYDRYNVQMQKQGFFSNKNMLLQLDANGTVHSSGPGGNNQLRRNDNTPVPEYYYRQLDREKEESENTRYFKCLFCGKRIGQYKNIDGDWNACTSCNSCEHNFDIANGILHFDWGDAVSHVAARLSHENFRPIVTKAENSILAKYSSDISTLIYKGVKKKLKLFDDIEIDVPGNCELDMDYYINAKQYLSNSDHIPNIAFIEDIIWGLNREEIETNEIGIAISLVFDMYINLAFIEQEASESKREILQSVGENLGLKREYVEARINEQTESLSPADELYIKLAAKLAKIDGIVEKKEVDEFKIVLEKMGCNNSQLKLARDVFNKAKTDVTDIDVIISEFSIKLVDELQNDESVSNIEMAVVGYLIGLIMITASDGKICNKEAEVIRKLEEKLNIEDGIVSKVLEGLNFDGMNMYELYHSYLILEVATDATDDEVRHAFRSKSKDYHPDRIHSMNLHDDFKKLAEKKFSELRTAYDEIMEHRRIYGTKQNDPRPRK